MKLQNILLNINFDDKRVQAEVDWESLSQVFNIDNLYYSDSKRLKAYHVKTWYCTDTWVGWVAYFLDNELVCMSFQSARKDSVDFEFVSEKLAYKVRDFLLTLTEPEGFTVSILDLEKEVPEKFSVDYNTQILHKTAWLDGEKVKILKTIYSWDDKERYFHTVEIQRENGKKEEVDCRKLLFDYNTLD